MHRRENVCNALLCFILLFFNFFHSSDGHSLAYRHSSAQQHPTTTLPPQNCLPRTNSHCTHIYSHSLRHSIEICLVGAFHLSSFLSYRNLFSHTTHHGSWQENSRAWMAARSYASAASLGVSNMPRYCVLPSTLISTLNLFPLFLIELINTVVL